MGNEASFDWRWQIYSPAMVELEVIEVVGGGGGGWGWGWEVG